MQLRLLLPVLALLFSPYVAGQPSSPTPFAVTTLTAEMASNPLGLETTEPSFSWRLQPAADSVRGLEQAAYRILVASSEDRLAANEGDVWDSGKVYSDQSIHVAYDGPALRSHQRYYWKVRVWDQNGRASAYSDAAWWEMGLLSDDEWSAEWISAIAPPDSMPPPRPTPMFRETFTTDRSIERARLYISGLGYYEAYLNGDKIGDHVLDPMLTHYDERVKYETYDVTDQLQSGANALGVTLGNGWYNQHTEAAWDFHQESWRAPPTLLAQLEITYADGSQERIETNEDWRVDTGPIVFDGIRNGEHYDARKEQPGWTKVDFDASDWDRPVIVDGPAGQLSSQTMQPIRVTGARSPGTVTEPEPNTYIYDFGQNLTGWANLTVSGPRGAEVTIRYGERLYEDGTLNQEELSRFIWTGETQTDHYFLKGEGTETWHPRFVYHGFRYAEVTVSSPKVTLDSITADVVHTDFDTVGHFESSNDLLNQIHQNTRWSYLGNYHGYPTDCPHREKIGWSGDAKLASQAGLYNFDAARGYRKWIDDFVDEQRSNGRVPSIIPTSGWGYTYGDDENEDLGYGPQWEGAFLIVPWNAYLFTGDEALLKRFYEPWTQYVDYLARNAEDYTVPWGINDHKPAYTETEPPILATGHFYECARIVHEAAEQLGNVEDASHYATLMDSIRAAYNRRFFNRASRTYGNRGQTSLGSALFYDLVPAAEEDRVLQNLLEEIDRRDGHIDAGVVGTKYVLNALTAHEEVETTYRMATKTAYPSWGNWIKKGATTLWQNWDGSQSRNHIMFGTVDEWMYEALAGIRYDPEHPGFKRTIIKPAPVGDLTWVDASHTSMYGDIRSSWEREDDRFSLDVRVPPNTHAHIHVPTTDPSSVTESGTAPASLGAVQRLRSDGTYVVFEVGSGTYRFASTLAR